MREMRGIRGIRGIRRAGRVRRIEKHSFLAAFCLLSLFFLFFDSQNRMQEFLGQYQGVSLRLEEGALAEELFGTEKAQEALRSTQFVKQRLGISEEEISFVTAWSQEKNVMITEEGLGRRAKVALIKVRGAMQDVLPASLRFGAFCTPEDEKGCVLDEETAYQLFGTAQALGNQVWVEGKPFTIRGVAKDELPVVLVLEQSKAAKFPYLEISCKNPTEEFLSLEFATEEFAVVEGPFYLGILRQLLWFPLWLLALWGVCAAATKMKAAWQQQGFGRAFLIWLLGLLAGGLAMAFLLKKGWVLFPLPLPDRYIPSQWSDFDFWGRKWEELQRLRQQLLYLHPCLKDVALWERLRFLVWEMVMELGLLGGCVACCLGKELPQTKEEKENEA